MITENVPVRPIVEVPVRWDRKCRRFRPCTEKQASMLVAVDAEGWTVWQPDATSEDDDAPWVLTRQVGMDPDEIRAWLGAV